MQFSTWLCSYAHVHNASACNLSFRDQTAKKWNFPAQCGLVLKLSFHHISPPFQSTYSSPVLGLNKILLDFEIVLCACAVTLAVFVHMIVLLYFFSHDLAVPFSNCVKFSTTKPFFSTIIVVLCAG